MISFDSIKLNSILKKFDPTYFEKYLHELVDSWLGRGKLNFTIYSNQIELEHWWQLELLLKQSAKQFMHHETDQVFEFH